MPYPVEIPAALRRSGKLVPALVLLCATGLWNAAPAQTAKVEIGTAKSIVKTVRAKLETEDRKLKANDPVFGDETILTTRNSASQLQFRDETTLTVGPNSEVVLDKFIFDPKTGKQEVAINASVGVFRFVTGKLKKQAYRIKTPTATIGIRGTIFTMIVDTSGATDIIVEEGIVQVSNPTAQVNTQVTVTPGLATNVAPGQEPSPPEPPKVETQTKVAIMDATVTVQGGPQATSSPAQKTRLLDVRDEAQELRESHKCGC